MLVVHNKPRRIKNPKGLTVDVGFHEDDITQRFKASVDRSRKVCNSKKWDYYKIYLRNLYGNSEFTMDRALDIIDRIKGRVEERLSNTSTAESLFVADLLKENNYSSKSTRRPGVTVKLFHTFYNDRQVMVKVYVYDPMCESLRTSVESNFENEVLFQIYANRLQDKLDFISPELYSWGQIRRHMFTRDGYKYKCVFLIMEYIHGLTLKEATYSTQNMRNIYEKVRKINEDLSGHLLHHNDFHGGNIMVRNPDSPLPDIILLDYGEASMGPRSPFFMF
jgi:hypothetical protein